MSASSAQPADPIIRIFDTTLRDGEQSPGAASLNLKEKLEIARVLRATGRGRY